MGFFGDLLKTGANTFTGGLASGLAGEASSIFSGIGSKKRLDQQINAQKQLNEQAAALNYEYGEKAAENAFARQLEMYERSYRDQSYATMRKQMEDAGLSVGLMYGGSASGGAGGATSGAPQAATGGAEAGRAANETERRAMELQQAQMGLALASQRADIKLKEAQANEANASATAAEETAGLTTEKKITEVQTRNALVNKLKAEGNLLERSAKLKTAETELTAVDTTLKNISLEIVKETKEWEKDKIRSLSMKAREDLLYAIEQVKQAEISTQIKKETIQDVVATYHAELKKIQTEAVKNVAGAKLSEQQIELVFQEAWSTWWENDHKGNRIALEAALRRADQELEAMRIDVEDRRTIVNALSNILGTTAGAAILRGAKRSNQKKALVWEEATDAYPWTDYSY